MAEDSIDRLAIEVTGDAEQAVRTLGRLINRLSSLETRLSMSASKALTFSAAIAHLSRSLSGMDVSPLKELNGIKFSATTPRNIESLANTLQQLPEDAVTKLQSVATALSSLRGISLTKGTVDSLARIPQVMREFESFDTGAFSAKMAELNPQVAQLAENVAKLAAAYKELPKSMQTAGLAARSVAASEKYLSQVNKELDSSSKKAKVSVSGLGSAMRKAFNFAGVAAGWYTLKRVFEGTVGQVNTYIEDMNLFNASMGEFAQSAGDYAKKVSDALGIDMGEWSKYQGVLQNLSTSFGIAGDRASVMSQNLTQLGYDLASFHNMNVDETMLKIQSGLAGEIEPMRRIGVDLSNAAMQVEATNLGLEKQVSDMSQAEKAALRYRLMLQGTAIAQNDMARTIASPANQLRVLKAQFQMAARAIGNLFIPALNAILPVVIGVVKAITLLAQTIAKFFGINATFEVDYSGLTGGTGGGGFDTGGIDDVTDSLDDSGDAADKANKKVKEYQNTVMGFDELHKLNATPEDTDDSGSGSGGGGGLGDLGGGGSVLDDIPLDTYDFLKGLTDNISKTTDEIAQKILGLLPHIAAVAAGLAAWRIARALGADLKTAMGWMLAIAGAVELVSGAFDAWNNGLNLGNLMQMLAGTAMLAGGLYLVFGKVGGAIGLIVGGLVTFVTSIHDAVVNGCNEFNALGATFGGVAMVIGSFLLGMTGPVTALVGAVAGGIMVVVGFMDAWNNGVDWGSLAMMFGGTLVAAFAAFMGGLGPVGIAVAAIVGGLAMVVAGAKDMFENGFSPERFAAVEGGFTMLGAAIGFLVAGPIGALVGALIGLGAGLVTTLIADWDGFVAWLGELWNGAVEATRFIWEPVATWFNDNVVTPVTEFFAGIGPFFEGLWGGIVTGISTWWGGVAQWMQDNVIQPIVDFWTPIVEWFSQLWSSISATAEAMWHNLGVFVNGIWQIIQRCWEVAGDWFDKNVLTPVHDFFAEKWEDIQNAVGAAWDAVKAKWDEAYGWFDQNVIQPIVNGFSNAWDEAVRRAEEAWNGITGAFAQFGSWFGGIVSDAWQQIKAAFEWGGRIFEGVVDAITDAFKWVMNEFIGGLNWAIAQPFNGLNSILAAMRSWEILGIRPFSGFWDVPVPQIPYLAQGRYGIDAGQLFVARERGPELVGQMGGKTTVANNQQIVEGIEAGVMSGVLRALATGGSQGGETTIEIPLYIGNEEIARATWRGEASLVRRGILQPQFG